MEKRAKEFSNSLIWESFSPRGQPLGKLVIILCNKSKKLYFEQFGDHLLQESLITGENANYATQLYQSRSYVRPTYLRVTIYLTSCKISKCIL